MPNRTYGDWSKRDPKSSATKKNLDLFKLLITSPRFQKIVEETRKNLGIHSPITKDSDFSKFMNDLMTKNDEIASSKKFITREISIKKNIQLTPRMKKKQLNLLYDSLPKNHLMNVAKEIVKEFRLPKHFNEAVWKYIVGGEVNAPYRNFKPAMMSMDESITHPSYVAIEIYTRLSQKELKELKDYIDVLSKDLISVTPLKDIDKKIKSARLFTERERVDDSGTEKYKVSAEEVAEQVYESKSERAKIYTAKRELADLRKKRFGKD